MSSNSGNYFYHKHIFDGILSDKHPHRQYIAIPVIKFNLVMAYSETPNLNHFERAILSICLGRYYTAQEISDLLLINVDLVKFILDNLKSRGLININEGTTEDGKNLLSNIYKVVTTKAASVFYDKNSKRIMRYVVSTDAIDSVRSSGMYILPQSEFVFLPRVPISPIRLDKGQNNPVKAIKERLRRDITEILPNDSKLINFEIVNEQEDGFLVTFIEPGKERGTVERWAVCSPFDIESNDINIRDYLYENISNKDVSSVVDKALKGERSRNVYNAKRSVIAFIKNSLFNKKIKDEDEILLEPLANVLIETQQNAIDKSTQTAERNRIFVLNAFDLFEHILYLAAKHDNFAYDDNIHLNKDAGTNGYNLCLLARQLGFNTDENTLKLLSIDKRSINNCINKPKGREIGACIALNLLISVNKQNHFMMELAKSYPDFLTDVYEIKRRYRDKTRHSFASTNTDLELFREIIYLLLDIVLDYKINEDKLVELSTITGTKNYSYSFEKIHAIFGNELFESNKKTCIDFKNNLISCYDLYVDKDGGYLGMLRSMMEQVFTDILKNGVEKYKIEFGEETIDSLFPDTSDVINYLTGLGFSLEPLLDGQGDISAPLSIKYNTDVSIRAGLENHFANVNLSYKLMAFVMMLRSSDDFYNSFDMNEPTVQGLISLVIAIMFLDKGHNQNAEFDESTANILMDKALDTLSYIYNNGNLINWR